MLKRFIGIFIVIIMIVFPLISFAEGPNEGMMDDVSQKIDSTNRQGDKTIIDASENTGNKVRETNKAFANLEKSEGPANYDKSLSKISEGAYSFFWQALKEIRKLSFPLCLLVIIAAALITNVIGPRNFAIRRLGITLMYGSLTFWVIAQVAPVVFLLLIQ